MALERNDWQWQQLWVVVSFCASVASAGAWVRQTYIKPIFSGLQAWPDVLKHPCKGPSDCYTCPHNELQSNLCIFSLLAAAAAARSSSALCRCCQCTCSVRRCYTRSLLLLHTGHAPAS
jgi:hypothetical protein